MALLALPAGLPLFRIAHSSLLRRPKTWGDSYSFRSESPSRALQPYNNIAHHVLFEPTPDGADLRCAFFWDERLVENGPKPYGKFKGLKILVPGKSCAIEDVQEQAHTFARRGDIVVCFDLRSQGMSARLCDNHHKVHVHHFDEYVADLMTVIRLTQRQFPESLPQLVAHSTGARAVLLALRSGQLSEGGQLLIDPRVTLLAPFLEAHELKRHGFVHYTALIAGRALTRAYMLGQDWNAVQELAALDDNNPYTTYQPGSLGFVQRRIEAHDCGEPRIIASDPTIEWINAAMSEDSRIECSTPEQWGNLKDVRLHVVLASDERIVCSQTAKAFAKQIKAPVTVLPGRHALIAESPEILQAIAMICDREPLPPKLQNVEEVPYTPPPELVMVAERGWRRVTSPYKSPPARPAASSLRRADAGSSYGR